jgi:hypothetical protein
MTFSAKQKSLNPRAHSGRDKQDKISPFNLSGFNPRAHEKHDHFAKLFFFHAVFSNSDNILPKKQYFI